MKRLSAIVLSAVFVLALSAVVQAKEKAPVKGEEQHHAISAANKGVIEKTEALKERLSSKEAGKKGIDKAAVRQDLDNIKKLMDDAKTGYGRLRDAMGKDEKKFDADINKMEERLAKAEGHLKALEEEVVKEKPDRNKMKQSSEGIVKEIKESEDRNKSMMKKRGIKG